MEKYQNAKTIGDGTYGSVLKAVNSQNGKRKAKQYFFRWDCCDKANEEEIHKVGLMHKLEGDLVPDETKPSKYSLTVRSNTRSQHSPLCFWIFRYECVSADERTKKIVSRADNKKHNVLSFARTVLYAQIELFS